MQLTFWFLAVVHCLSHFADVWTTNRVLHHGGRELNPFLKLVMAHLGTRWWLVKIPLALGILFCAYPSPWALAALTVPFIFIAIRNYGQVK